MVPLKPQPMFGFRNGRGVTRTLQKQSSKARLRYILAVELGKTTSSVLQATKVPYTTIHNKVATRSTDRDHPDGPSYCGAANKRNLRV